MDPSLVDEILQAAASWEVMTAEEKDLYTQLLPEALQLVSL